MTSPADHDDVCRIGNDLGGWCTCESPRCPTCGHRAHPGGPNAHWCSASPVPGVYCYCTTHTDSTWSGATGGATSTASVVSTPDHVDPAAEHRPWWKRWCR